MSLATYEGIVENGQIRFDDKVELPEHARVYVIVLDTETRPTARIASPRLVDRRDAVRFKLEIVEEPADAGI